MQIDDKETLALCDAVKAVLGESADHKPNRGGKGHDDFIEGNEFTAAAAKAAVAGDKEFEFEGKTYPVTMDVEVAKKILGESSGIEEGNEFTAAAAKAAVAGDKELEFGGKTYPVTMDVEVAKKILGESAENKLLAKDLEMLIKDPDPAQVKQYGGKDKYVQMLKTKLAKLQEARIVGIDFSSKSVTDDQLKAWLRRFSELRRRMKGSPWDNFKDDLNAAEKEAKKRGLTIEEGLSSSDYKKAQAIIDDPKTKGGDMTQAMKDLEKWKKGSSDDEKVLQMLRQVHYGEETIRERSRPGKQSVPGFNKKLITKRKWDKADEDQRDAWLSGAFKDPDDIDKHINSKWQDLPPQATSNMYESVELNEGILDKARAALEHAYGWSYIESEGRDTIRFDWPLTPSGRGDGEYSMWLNKDKTVYGNIPKDRDVQKVLDKLRFKDIKWADGVPRRESANKNEEVNESVADIIKKVKKLKVGDKTNFGEVKAISDKSITVKAKDTPKTEIPFRQPKLGSRDLVLDQLVKLTPDGKRLAKESADLEEATMSQGVKQAQKHIDSLESSLKKGSNLNKGINKALEGKYDADFIKMEKAMSQILDVWQDIEYEFGQSVGESVELDEALKAGRGEITVDLGWDLDGADADAAERKYKIKLKITPAKLAGHADTVSITGDKKNVLAYVQSGDYGVDISGRPSSKGLSDGDIKDMFPEIMETYDNELDEAIEEIVKEENLDVDSLSEEQLDELLGGALKKLAKKAGSAIKSRVTTSGRADRAEKKADKADKKEKDRERLKKAKERLAAQKQKKKDAKAKARKESVELDETIRFYLGEALKAGKGKRSVEINFNGNTADVKSAEKKYKLKFKMGKYGAEITGDKKNILAYLQSADYGLEDEDILDTYSEILETYDKLDEASESDLKKILAAAKKAGGRVKGNTVDFGMGTSIDFSIEKGKIKFDGGRATGVGYFDNVNDALASLAAGLD